MNAGAPSDPISFCQSCDIKASEDESVRFRKVVDAYLCDACFEEWVVGA